MDIIDSDNYKFVAYALDAATTKYSELNWHKHKKGQLALAVAGTQVMLFEDAKFILPPTMALWIPANVLHNGYNNGAIKQRFIYFDLKYYAMLPQEVTLLRVSDLLRELIKKTCELEWEVSKISAYQENIINLIGEEILAANNCPFFVPLPKSTQLIKAVELIQSKKGNVIASEIAEEIGMTPRNLTRKFSAELKMNFKQWVQQYKMMKSLELLAKGKNITYISHYLGYESDSAFITMFKKHTNMSPVKFHKTQSLSCQ